MNMLLILAILYFIPTMNAILAGHQNSFAIFVLNFFLGWTLIGWVGALIWSCIR